MTRNQPYRWWNLLFYLGVITLNALAVLLPLGGNSTKEISDRYYIYLTPAGYAFSIWSVIYALVACFVIYQLTGAAAKRESIRQIGPWFIISCAFNMGWIWLWHHLHIELALGAMLGLLVSLIMLYLVAVRIDNPTLGERLFIRIPFSIYLGWISVATIVNVGIVLEKNGWNGFGLADTTWAVIMLFVGAVLAVAVSLPYRNFWYPLVFVWAYIAIAVEHQEAGNVFVTGLVLAGVLLVYSIGLAIMPLLRQRR